MWFRIVRRRAASELRLGLIKELPIVKLTMDGYSTLLQS
jgi:hypothetical protein